MSDRDFPLPDHHDPHPERPGSAGEHVLQDAMGTGARAERFLSDQMSDRLVPSMQEFIARMTMAFVATADAHGLYAKFGFTPLTKPNDWMQIRAET